MLTEKQQQFLEAMRVGRFATVGADGQPHVIPVCYALIGGAVFFTIDEKPKKQSETPLKRLQNLTENPKAALVVDHYEEDWRRLGWVMVQGRADILTAGDEHDLAQSRLRRRYPQLQAMRIETLPVVALRVGHVASWGKLDRD